MDISKFKENLKAYYNAEAEIRNEKSVKPEWKIKVREEFLNSARAENKKTLLELGAGAGYDSLFFKDNGLDVTAVDLSGEMVRLCKSKGINALELDFYRLNELKKKFDCIYSINALLHVPKTDLSGVFENIASVLDENGLFYLGMYGGEDREGDFVIPEISSAPRLFVFNSEEYLRPLISEYFNIRKFETLSVNEDSTKDTFLSVTCESKNRRKSS